MLPSMKPKGHQYGGKLCIIYRAPKYMHNDKYDILSFRLIQNKETMSISLSGLSSSYREVRLLLYAMHFACEELESSIQTHTFTKNKITCNALAVSQFPSCVVMTLMTTHCFKVDN